MAPRRAAAASAAKKDTKSATETRSTRPKRAVTAPKPAAVTKPAAPAAKKQKAAATKATATKAAAATKKAAPKKAAPKKPATTSTKKETAAPASKKRKAVEVDEDEARETKKSRVTPAPKPKVTKSKVVKPKVEKPKVVKPKVIINERPTTRLNIFVCGEGSSGELGLGTAKKAVDVKRPRLNPLLSAEDVGVVHIAVGGMHCVALTHDNKILTWGVNDQGALGRDTAWEGGMKDIDDNKSDASSDSGSDSGLNPHESTPTAIPSDEFPEGTTFVAAAASDSASFVLTDEGLVYGWGTFRGNEGILGFDADSEVQNTPVLIPGLKKIKQIACGDNHVLALDDKGAVFSWGSGQQNQLGRRIVERTRLHGLEPRQFGLPKGVLQIACGSFHSFALHKNGRVYGWGLNSFGETGVDEGAGDDEAAILHPTIVQSLTEKNITQISGGGHHSMAVTESGECLVWGRCDGSQSGFKLDTLPESAVVKDDRGRPRIISEPSAIPGLEASYVSAGPDHSLALDKDGRIWSWGFSANYQTGQGTDDDIEVATVVENTAVRGKKLNWVGAGGQFSVFTEEVQAPATNGINGHA
ncbi:hypothetical protein FQN54_002435 [Arachnomyces sp. PD_36]|nr:hypothetical protein FQN54_002435 [Arachnomyces sp. PD_36]